jgi:hypothetical protein
MNSLQKMRITGGDARRDILHFQLHPHDSSDTAHYGVDSSRSCSATARLQEAATSVYSFPCYCRYRTVMQKNKKLMEFAIVIETRRTPTRTYQPSKLTTSRRLSSKSTE